MTDCKTCSKCGEVKAASEFYLGKARPCKECSRKTNADYYKANSKKLAASATAYYKANPEKAAAWRNANSEKVNTTRNAWRKENPRKMRAYRDVWKKKNPEKVNATRDAWIKANPEKVAATATAYYKANLEKFTARSKAIASEMRPSYIAQRIGLPVAQLSPELLALKREQLATHRLSKQITQAIKAQGAPA